MKKIFLFVLGLSLAGVVPAQRTISDPNAVVRAVTNFHGIQVSNAFDVYLSQGNEEAVAVSAADVKYRDMIRVEVKDGILHIDLDNKGWKWSSGNKKLRAYISFKSIDKLNISGACDVMVEGSIKSDALSLNLSGASDLKGKMDVKKLTIDISGASDMTVSGTSNDVKIEVSGASEFKGTELSADYVVLEASGASDVRITVNKELSARASGSSEVRYKGEGVVREVRSSGSSSISKN